MNAKWSFTDPPNVAVLTTKQVLNKEEWIAYVFHDEDDGTWQFHSLKSNTDEGNAKVVSLKSITEIDPSIIELADLPLGWKAYRLKNTDAWIKCPAK